MRKEKTVETVPLFLSSFDTGLKPGVNEMSQFPVFQKMPLVFKIILKPSILLHTRQVQFLNQADVIWFAISYSAARRKLWNVSQHPIIRRNC